MKIALRICIVIGFAGAPALAGCGEDTARGTDRSDSTRGKAITAPADRVPASDPWVPRPIVVAPDPRPVSTAMVESVHAVADSGSPADSTRAPTGKQTRHKTGSGQRRPYQLSAADSARWPVKGPAPMAGALLPEHMIVAYYGNPKSNRMGVLGQGPPEEMLPRLERTARGWAKAEPGRKVMPALHLIATVAQGKPGTGGKYRLRHSDQTIEQVLGWAEQRGWIVLLDVQIGHSTVPDELPHLVKYLERPYVHLALDPEFAMKLGGLPGRRIGTLDASDVNYAIRLLAGIVEEKKVPPKILVVHRFTQRMLTNHDKITLDPRVQVVVDMDGFGSRWLKEDGYKFFIVPEPVEYTGFKLFYKNDRDPRTRRPDFTPSCSVDVYETVGCGDDGLMTPEQVLKLWPRPVYVQYQ
jgi:hypothetical protein